MSSLTSPAILNADRLWAGTFKTAFVLAHPGHELRLYDLLRAIGPDVHILTNGSRASATRRRREASAALIASLGGELREVWTGLPDTALYSAIMEKRHDVFLDWTTLLAEDLIARGAELVVTDAWQYYNIAHDLTHLMARAAAAEASARVGREIPVLECQVVPAGLAPTAPEVMRRCMKKLDAEAADAKKAAAYRYPDVAGEIADIETHEAHAAYALECLFEPAPISLLREVPAAKPAYESYGEARVATGLYKDVLRWRHAESLIQVLCDRVLAPQERASLPA